MLKIFHARVHWIGPEAVLSTRRRDVNGPCLLCACLYRLKRSGSITTLDYYVLKLSLCAMIEGLVCVGVRDEGCGGRSRRRSSVFEDIRRRMFLVWMVFVDDCVEWGFSLLD